MTATKGPDYATGWSLVDAKAALDLLREVPKRIIEDAANQGEIDSFDFVVDEAGPLRVILAWDDVATSSKAGHITVPQCDSSSPPIYCKYINAPKLINDLDLELVAPDGTIHYPWQLGHTILDSGGNPLADYLQPPGTPIQVERTVTPNNNPFYDWSEPVVADRPKTVDHIL